jgi:anaerobic magnesium-protoporphyrin IX monomethyl ester cyclase
LDWNNYDVITPVMKARVHPALIQMLQFYGNYSFYARRFLEGKLRPHRHNEAKRTLLSNAQQFIVGAMPTYLRDVLSVPVKVLSTIMRYNSLAKTIMDDERVDELLQFSNKVIYQEDGSSNRYFLIKEPA